MADVPIYRSTQDPRAGAPLGRAVGVQTIDTGVGALANDIANTVARSQAVMRQKAEKDAAAWASETLASAQLHWTEELEKRKRSQAGDPSGFTDTVIKDFTAHATEIERAAPTKEWGQQMRTQLLGVERNLLTQSMAFEGAATIDYRGRRIDEGRDKGRRTVELDPSQYSEILNQQLAAIQIADLPQEVAADKSAKLKRELSMSAMYRLVQDNPRVALAELKNKKPKLPWVSDLDPDDSQRLRAAAENEVERQNQRAEMLALRREAAAERVVAQVERQIAAGVPLTPEMWRQQGAAVRGTQAARDFLALQKSEQDVQQLLRKPINEQVAFVNDLDAKLTKTGGTLQDAANIQRLRGAVARTQKLLTEDPLQYAARSYSVPVQPIDLQSIGTAEGMGAGATVIADRVATLKGLRAKQGAAVPFRPLMSAEASQLGAVMQQANAKQQGALLTSLRRMSPDDQTYRAILQQVAPDKPVIAFAGLLASEQQRIALDQRGADPVFNGDIAARVLRGQELLDPSKVSKGADGKPISALYAPNQQEFLRIFNREVGGVFANNPAAAETVLQTARAYYAGASIERGQLGDGTASTIDTKLVRESMRAVAGEVVKFNGERDVLAPLGMPASQFKALADQALADQLADQGLPDMVDRREELGLMNGGSSTSFVVVSGDAPLLDPKGNPVVIDINPNAARRGKILRSQ